ncbi:hypothetical protein [Propionibacterium freudenreichii]|uniref:hypothetical protein n=1 Tax=Propionibacterium freudenreichii TaxID=1744 RepID=UPI00254B8611|nr:hypothetical protein [Propionibacterium freudenreichii]MDK9342154.1 hypothetical protein [Propionibacterium freudenreichii]
MDMLNLAGNGGNSFRFDQPGATVTGQILDMSEEQQTDLQTGEPKTFSNGQPMLMYRVELLTDERDPGDQFDEGKRSIYLKGSRASESKSSMAAVLDAVKKATGSTNLAAGGILTLTYVGDGVAKNRGFNAPKLYEASYAPPMVDLSGGEQQMVQQAAPAQQPAPVQQASPVQTAPVQQEPVIVPPAAAPQPAAQQAAPAPAAPQITPEVLAALTAAGTDVASLKQAMGLA